MDIEELLRKYGLPRVMEVRPDDTSGWMVPFAIQAQEICAVAGASFAFLESRDMQAVAFQDRRDVVGVYAGMFWMLCRLSSLVAASGVFPAMNGSVEPTWTPDVGRSLRTPRDLLDEKVPFDWEIESAAWKEDGERQILFYVVLAISFRFVVFHELGHIVNDHGRRRTYSGISPLLVDHPGPGLCEPEEALESQARELIADGFAFKHTIATFNNELSSGSHLELAQIVRKHLAPDALRLIGFVLSVIFLYFRLSDLPSWKSTPINRLSHPPAPFRMKALFAQLVETKPLGISESSAASLVSETMLAGDALMSIMLDIFPQPNWIKQISTPAYDRHFGQIYEQIANWSGRLPTS